MSDSRFLHIKRSPIPNGQNQPANGFGGCGSLHLSTRLFARPVASGYQSVWGGGRHHQTIALPVGFEVRSGKGGELEGTDASAMFRGVSLH